MADDLPDAPWATAPPAAGADLADAPWASPAAPQASPSLGHTAMEGVKALGRGAEGFLGTMGEAAMGPFGPTHTLGNVMADFGLGERPATEPGYGQQLAKATGMEANPQSTAEKYVGSIGETLGDPSTYFGPGGWFAKGLMGAASGAGSEAAGQATEGTSLEPWARIAGGMAAGPLAARTLKPQLAPAQQALANAGIRLTPGQMAGDAAKGMFKSAEDKATSVPILGDFIQSARSRSIGDFNRAVANQALEPIGQQLERGTAAGHDTISEVRDKIGAAYDNLVPYLELRPDRQWLSDLRDVYQRNAQILPAAEQQRFQNIIDQQFGRPTPLDGEKVKRIEQRLTELQGKFSSSSNADHQILGDALGDTVQAMRQNLERMNPGIADELASTNRAYAMYARMRVAAANRRGSEGMFSPGDLLTAVKRGDKSVQKGSFAQGNALMQRFGEAAQHVLPSKVPDSGTTGRALASGLIGGAAAGAAGAGHAAGLVNLLNPKLLAGVAAASAPYTGLGSAAINRYVRPTTGLRAGYSNVGRGAGMLRPLMHAAQSPFGQGASDNPYAP